MPSRISQYGNSLEKRQATLQLCIRADGKVVRTALIFRGKPNSSYYTTAHGTPGTRGFRKAEASRYDPRVDVYYQEKAWADANFSCSWLDNTFLKSPLVNTRKPSLLLTDNLHGQSAVDGAFKEHASRKNTLIWNFPPGCTDEVQPVDAGFGQQVKCEIGHQQQKWLDGPSCFQKP